MGYCFFIAGAIVSWSSKRQRTVSKSTTEAEYIALGYAAREGVWIRRFLNELALNSPRIGSSANVTANNDANANVTDNANVAAIVSSANVTAKRRTSANVAATAYADVTAEKKADTAITAKRRAGANEAAEGGANEPAAKKRVGANEPAASTRAANANASASRRANGKARERERTGHR